MIFAIIAIVIALLIIAAIFAKNSHLPDVKKSRGSHGESEVAELLGNTEYGKQYIINDLLFKTESGQSCQIDHILINIYGIWVIETKNYSGTIYGQENQREWTQVLAGGNKNNKFYNPIKQNATHIYHLSEYLNIKYIFQNVVVFLPRADISNIASDSVYSIYELPSIKNKATNVLLTVNEMENYYYRLTALKNNSTISHEEHIDNINRMQRQIKQGICPRCGGNLVLRNGINGQFYGCSNYPKCKFTKNIE